MVVENTASEINDTLLITSTSPLVGIVKFTGWADITIGETSTRYFNKTFSYSVDGIFFTPWQPLTTANVQAIEVNSTDYFYVTYRYTRAGTDTSGLLEFQEVDLLGEFEAVTCANYTVLPQSMFNDIFCYNPRQIYLCGKLTKKMYDKGIVAEYVTRGDTQNPQVDDRDYLDFWDAVCCFFALILVQAEKLENITAYPKILSDYVRQKGLYFCNDISQADLIYLMNNSFDQISKRGTVRIFKQADNIVKVDGEFLRLICFDALSDDFNFALVEDELHGFDVDESSPTYAGTSESIQLVKAYEATEGVSNLSNYPLVAPNFISIVLDPNNSLRTGMCIQNVQANLVSGIGPSNFANPQLSSNLDKAFIIDPGLDYEITFEVNQQVGNSSLSFGVVCLDAYGNLVDPYLSSNTNVKTRFFFQTQNLIKNNETYQVRGILYNGDQAQLSLSDAKLNVGFGSSLTLDSSTLKILPFLLVDYSSTSVVYTQKVYVFNFKVRPLVVGQCANEQVYFYNGPSAPANTKFLWRNSVDQNYYTYNINTLSWQQYKGNLSDFLLNLPVKGTTSVSFVGVKNTILTYCKNNNGALSLNEIKKISDRYLIPHDSILEIIDSQGLYNSI